MIRIDPIDTRKRSDVIRFYRVPFSIYEGCSQWVPPLWADLSLQMNRKKHPFYEHSELEFFVAVRDGKDVGRIAVFENKPYNKYHNRQVASFYLFETINDLEVATALFDTAFAWARKRGLTGILGPKGFGPVDGYGMQVEGFEHRQTMMMMPYNHAYYPQLLEKLGFRKEVDFITCLIHRDNFHLPERVHKVADWVLKRGTFQVHTFKNRGDMLKWVPQFIDAYNKAFIHNWEYYPLSQREVDFVVDNIMQLLDSQLIKMITHKDRVVGFVLAFPDVSKALQRTRGYIPPFSFLDSIPSPKALVDILMEVGKTEWIALNGGGVLPEFKGIGGNALMYTEMENTLNARFQQFRYGELCQVAETAVEMRADLVNLGGKPYKNHRVYFRALDSGKK
jgi:hypothetical protein